MSSYDFAIVGAGISGAALAYYLKKGGARRVLLLERGAPASGGTGKSAAIVRQHYSTTLMARLANLAVWQLDAAASQQLATLANRAMQLQVTVQDGLVWVWTGDPAVKILRASSIAAARATRARRSAAGRWRRPCSSRNSRNSAWKW